MFLEFKEQLPVTIEEIRVFFSSIDFQNKGYVTKDDFLQLLTLSDSYKKNPQLV